MNVSARFLFSRFGMSCQSIDGKSLAATLHCAVGDAVDELINKFLVTPRLDLIVGRLPLKAPLKHRRKGGEQGIGVLLTGPAALGSRPGQRGGSPARGRSGGGAGSRSGGASGGGPGGRSFGGRSSGGRSSGGRSSGGRSGPRGGSGRGRTR